LSNYEGQKEDTDKYSLRGRVFKKIRGDILIGKYKENEELKETAIGTELGVSRTPVREALRQLELEGLIKIIPNKGAYVTGITEKDVMDIYKIRAKLEGLCARWATASITSEQIEQLEEITYLSEFHAKRQNFEQVFELDSRFHEILYIASNSKILDHVLTDFHAYVQRVRRMTISSPVRAPQSNEEHKQILEAIKEKNPDKAEELATTHIMNTIKSIDLYNLEQNLDNQE
jgi:Transcriptional regulators